MANAELTLDVEKLTVNFGEHSVLADVSFRVQRGTTLAILGPNGAGKTVLFRALIGALPSSGSIRWASDARIGYVPQKLDLERDVPITGVDFLSARATLAGEPGSRISEALALVGITPEVAHRPIGILSGGQFQRILIAFALVGNPNVLLLDEPTAGVDEPGQEQLNDLVQRLQRERGLTVLFISHELTMVYRYADNVLCLSRDVVCMGPPGAVITPQLLHDMYGSDMGHHVHAH